MAATGVYRYVETVGPEEYRQNFDSVRPVFLNTSFYAAGLNFYHALIAPVGNGSGVVHENLTSYVVCSVIGGVVRIVNPDVNNPAYGVVRVYVGSSGIYPSGTTLTVFDYNYFVKAGDKLDVEIPECSHFPVKSGENLYFQVDGNVDVSSWFNICVDS